MDHQNVIDGKARDHIDILVGITAIQEPVRPLRPREFPDRLAGEPVVRRDR